MRAMGFGISQRNRSRSHKRARGVACLRAGERTDAKMNWNDRPLTGDLKKPEVNLQKGRAGQDV